MCYSIPGRVVETKGRIAIVDYFGEKRSVLNEFTNARKGDYVYAQGGVVVDKVPEKQAVEILNLWREKFFELKKIDEKLAVSSKRTPIALNAFEKYILEILRKPEIGRKELLELLRIRDEASIELLLKIANSVRQAEHGNACCVHGIIEFSNYCKNNCFYCGLRSEKNIERYRMSVSEVVETAEHAVKKLGFKALVLQSGEDFWYDEGRLVEIVEAVNKFGVLIFLSIGVRSEETFKKLFKAGARGVLLRFETSNKKLFERLRPGTSFEERIDLIKSLKKMGFVVATGFLIGLPGETEDDVVNNILLTKSLNADMYSFGPLIPARGTPLENVKPVDVNTVLKVIAVTRLFDKGSKILVTTALETLSKEAKRKGLMAGANSLMINVTPPRYKRLYEIYSRQASVSEKKEIQETIELLYSLGRAPTDLGFY